MPRGIVVSIEPRLISQPCDGVVKAIAADPAKGINEGELYRFRGGDNDCCKVNNTVEIERLIRPGWVKLDCSQDFDATDEPEGSASQSQQYK